VKNSVKILKCYKREMVIKMLSIVARLKEEFNFRYCEYLGKATPTKTCDMREYQKFPQTIDT
jgi:DNA-directed RNA polymerase